MKSRAGLPSSVTLIERTVVIDVLIAFFTLTFVGFKARLRGSDRAACVANIRQVQQAVRGYSNLYALFPGQNPRHLSGAIELEHELIGPGKYVMPPPLCPGEGRYNCGGNEIPLLGDLYMTCSLAASDNHVPKNAAGWQGRSFGPGGGIARGSGRAANPRG